MGRNKNRTITKYILLLLVFLSCSGCKRTETAPVSEATAEDLIEPVVSQDATCKAFYGDILVADILDGRVSPEVSYLSFEESVVFGEYSYGIGDSVTKGEVLAKSYSAETEDAVEGLEDQLQAMKDKYAYDKATSENRLAILKYQLQALGDNKKAEEYINKKAEIESMKLSIQQATDLEEIDVAYISQQISDLRDKSSSAKITAPFDGDIVSFLNVNKGDQVSNTAKVIALADNCRTVIQTKYIDKNAFSQYERIYALFHGSEYEIEYSPYDNTEYKNLVAAGETPVGNFKFKEAGNDGLLGSYGVVVLVKDESSHVICIPNEAINMDATGKFVYKSENDKKVRYDVVTGITDGIYTEIISGVSEGELIYTKENDSEGEFSEHAVIKDSFQKDFEDYAKMVWLTQKELTFDPEGNPLVFVSYAVKKGDVVTAGQTVAYVTSDQDEVALTEKQYLYDSVKEKLTELKDSYTKDLKEKKEEKTTLTLDTDIGIKEIEIKQLELDYQYQKAELKKQLAELAEDIKQMSARTDLAEIVAPSDCIITELGDLSKGDQILATTTILKTSDQEDYYLVVEDAEDSLNYHMKVKIANDGQEVTGVVVSTWNDSLPVALQYKPAVIRLSEPITMKGNRITVKAETNVMKQVCMVDRSYIYNDSGNYYVKEMNAAGEVNRKTIIPGGYNKEYCWVVSGLSEAMKIKKNTN